jgi:hypothetical protein
MIDPSRLQLFLFESLAADQLEVRDFRGRIASSSLFRLCAFSSGESEIHKKRICGRAG